MGEEPPAPQDSQRIAELVALLGLDRPGTKLAPLPRPRHTRGSGACGHTGNIRAPRHGNVCVNLAEQPQNDDDLDIELSAEGRREQERAVEKIRAAEKKRRMGKEKEELAAFLREAGVGQSGRATKQIKIYNPLEDGLSDKERKAIEARAAASAGRTDVGAVTPPGKALEARSASIATVANTVAATTTARVPSQKSRPALTVLSPEDFMRDLERVWEARGVHMDLTKRYNKCSLADVAPLDLFGMYRAVCVLGNSQEEYGGLRGKRWDDVFRAMTNGVHGRPVAQLSQRLRQYFKNFLECYSRAYPQDASANICYATLVEDAKVRAKAAGIDAPKDAPVADNCDAIVQPGAAPGAPGSLAQHLQSPKKQAQSLERQRQGEHGGIPEQSRPAEVDAKMEQRDEGKEEAIDRRETNDAPQNGACDIAVGSMVEVYWPMDNEWWPAKVTRFDKELNWCFVYYYTVACREDDGWVRLNGEGAQYIRLDRGNVKRE